MQIITGNTDNKLVYEQHTLWLPNIVITKFFIKTLLNQNHKSYFYTVIKWVTMVTYNNIQQVT